MIKWSEQVLPMRARKRAIIRAYIMGIITASAVSFLMSANLARSENVNTFKCETREEILIKEYSSLIQQLNGNKYVHGFTMPPRKPVER